VILHENLSQNNLTWVLHTYPLSGASIPNIDAEAAVDALDCIKHCPTKVELCPKNGGAVPKKMVKVASVLN